MLLLGLVGGDAAADVERVNDGVITGGHSRWTLTSSRALSPVLFETTEPGRDEGVEDWGAFFWCCSKRPIRFATLARGRSSGRGLRAVCVVRVIWFVEDVLVLHAAWWLSLRNVQWVRGLETGEVVARLR